jgi:hypothetical protein
MGRRRWRGFLPGVLIGLGLVALLVGGLVAGDPDVLAAAGARRPGGGPRLKP